MTARGTPLGATGRADDAAPVRRRRVVVARSCSVARGVAWAGFVLRTARVAGFASSAFRR